MLGLGLSISKAISSLLNYIVSTYNGIVLGDSGTVEGTACLNTNTNALLVEDSAYTDYSTRVFNEIGMVEPSESETFDNTLASILAIDTPSVLLIPNGRREGKLYSALPTNGSGDFLFTGIDANGGRTRVNKAGQIEVVRRNLLPYSSTQSVWAPTTGFTRTNATIRGNAASNLVVTATQNGVGYQMGLKYSNIGTITLVSGSTYTFSFRVRPLDGNGNFAYYIYAPSQIGASFNVFTGATSSNYADNCTKVGRSITNEGNGIYLCSETFTMTANATLTTATLTIGFGNDLSSQVIGRNADFGTPQLELGSFPTIYQEANNGISQPRIDYSSGNAAFLAEPQRTNLLQNNATFSGYTFDGGTFTSNIFTEDTANTGHRINTGFYSGFAGATLYCYSIIVSKVSGANRWVKLSASDSSTGEVGSKFLNLQTGALSGTETAQGNWLATGLTTGVIALPNGRYLLYLVAQCSVMANSLLRILFSDNGTNTSYLGTGASFEVLYPQAEAGTYPTSRIVTETSSKTRIADQFSKQNITSLIGQPQGTIFVNVTLKRRNFSRRIVGVTNMGLTNRVVITTTGNAIGIIARANGSIFANITSSELFIEGRNKIAFAYSSGNCSLFLNGVLVGTSNDIYTFSQPITDLYVAQFEANDNTGQYDDLYGPVGLFLNRLSDAQCIALTT